MNVHGYELLGEWKNSTCGKVVKATRGGKTFFLKRYQTPVKPVMNGALDAKTFENNSKLFDKYIANRKRVNTTLRSVAGSGGNIIIPCEEFVEENHYTEASEFVEGVVDEDEVEDVLASLSNDVKKLLMLTAAGALSSVHGKGIVHSDLKLTNVLLARNSSGNYVAKLIDFDSSYFLDDKPIDDIIGDINFYSPELGVYSDVEDEDEKKELIKTLTEKSDIFSLGLIFHFYLAGALPQAKTLSERLKKRKEKGKAIYCWSVLNNDCELAMSDKITSLKYLTLIQDMLNKDPEKRPTAIQVLQRLKAPDTEGLIEEPWPEHRIMLDTSKLKTSGYVVFKKVIVAGAKKYELVSKEGKKVEYSADELQEKGFAKSAREEKFADPWPEHKIEFDEIRMRSRGFVASEQRIMSGIKGYALFRADSSSMFFNVDKLLAMKYAAKKVSHSAPITESICDPWPEHSIVFDVDQIKRKGYSRIERMSMGGVNGYSCIKADGTSQFIRIEMLLIQKMAKNS